MDRANIPYSASAEVLRLMAMRQTDSPLLDELYPQRVIERIEREKAFWSEEAKELSDRQLLEEIYVMLKISNL